MNTENLLEKKEPFLIANRIITPDGTTLWSRFCHDYVEYTDANGETYFVDGGTDYIRTSKNKQHAMNFAVYSDDDFEIIRMAMLRGTFDINDNRIWVPLYKINNAHLQAILDYNEEREINSKFDQFIKQEIKFREENGIFIEDSPYKPEDGVLNITK